MSIQLEGLEDILANIEQIADTSKLDDALKTACALVERSAKEKAPKGDGELRRSITSKVEDSKGIVYTPLFYAPYTEYGTGLFAENGNGRQNVPWVYVEGSTKESKSTKTYTEEEAKATVAYLREKGLPAYSTSGQKPQPFMRPALNENREEILRIIKGGLLND